MAAPRRAVTPEMFAGLVADLRTELAAATPEHRAAMLARPRRAHPAAFRSRNWVRQHAATLRDAADLTGMAYASLRVYSWRGDQARADDAETHRSMPGQAPTGGWVIGQLALWMATRNEAKAKGDRTRWPSHERYYERLRALVDRSGGRVTQRAVALELGLSTSDRRLCAALLREIGAPPPRRATEEEVMPFLRELAAQGDRTRTLQEVSAALDDAGLHMHAGRVSRLYVKAGGRMLDLTPSDDDELTPLESTRWDGLVSEAQIARGYGISPSLVTQARRAGHIKWEKRQEHGTTRDGKPVYRYFYDPGQLTTRRDMRRGPVMKGHPLAVGESTEGTDR